MERLRYKLDDEAAIPFSGSPAIWLNKLFADLEKSAACPNFKKDGVTLLHNYGIAVESGIETYITFIQELDQVFVPTKTDEDGIAVLLIDFTKV